MVAITTTQTSGMNEIGQQWQRPKPQQQQHEDTHNGNEDNGNKTAAIRQWRKPLLLPCAMAKQANFLRILIPKLRQ
jgi:hypothetical protein